MTRIRKTAVKKVLCPLLINAEVMRVAHPNTFGRPDAEELSALKKGDIVKVAIQGERFWVIITKVKQPVLEGIVDNDLLTDQLKYKDLIRFHTDNIYQIHAL